MVFAGVISGLDSDSFEWQARLPWMRRVPQGSLFQRLKLGVSYFQIPEMLRKGVDFSPSNSRLFEDTCFDRGELT